MTNLSDKQLLEYFRGGVRPAFSHFYNEHNKAIHKYLLDTCANADWAKELTEEVFMRLWDLRKRVKSKNHLLACLYLFARTLMLGKLQGPTPAEEALKKLVSEAERWELMNEYLDVTSNRILVRLDAGVRSLPPQRKRVLRMLFVEGLDTKAVARTLSIGIQTVLNTKGDALESLVKVLYDRELFQDEILKALLVYLDQG